MFHGVCCSEGQCLFEYALGLRLLTHPNQSRSGRIYSPFEPWQTSPNTPVQAALPSSNELLVLQTGADFGLLLQPASLLDHQRGEHGMDEPEGAEAWPPPEDYACIPMDSPPSTPPSSPSSSAMDLSAAHDPLAAALPTSPAVASSTSLPASPPPPPASAGPTGARKLKQRAGKAARRARDRLNKVKDPLMAQVKPALSRIWQKPQTFVAAFAVELLPAGGGGFTGRRTRFQHDRATPWTLEELSQRGFRLIQWDGRFASSFFVFPPLTVSTFRTPYAIVDKNGRLFVLLCGRPRDPGWDGVNNRFAEAVRGAREGVSSKGCQRRGEFTNASVGVIIGQGAKVRPLPQMSSPAC